MSKLKKMKEYGQASEFVSEVKKEGAYLAYDEEIKTKIKTEAYNLP